MTNRNDIKKNQGLVSLYSNVVQCSNSPHTTLNIKIPL